MIYIEKEIKLYPYIERILNGKGAYILQNEVKFLEQIKSVDLFGEDFNYYYAIEVKFKEVSQEDYCNLDYIIKNNSIGKPIKGILVGLDNKKKEPTYYNEIRKNPNIELILFNKDILKQNIKCKIKHHNEYYNPNVKFWRYIFIWLSDIDINNIKVNGNYIEVAYKIARGKTFYYRGYIGEDGIIVGDTFIEEFNLNFGKILNTRIDKNIEMYEIRNVLYRAKLIELQKKKTFINMMDEGNKSNEIYFNIRYILKFITLDTLVGNLMWHRMFISGSRNNGIFFYPLEIDYNIAIFIDIKYAKILDSSLFYNKNGEFVDLGYAFWFSKKYNRITYLEFTNILVNNKLYIPNKKIIYGNDYVILTLEIKIEVDDKEKKVLREFRIKTFDNVVEADFYLITNFDIIMEFENEINSNINSNNFKIISYEDNNTINYIRDKDMERLREMSLKKTIRELISEYKMKNNED